MIHLFCAARSTWEKTFSYKVLDEKVLLLPALTRRKESVLQLETILSEVLQEVDGRLIRSAEMVELEISSLAGSVWLKGVRVEERKWEHLQCLCVCVCNFFVPSSISRTIIVSESIFTSVVKYNRSLSSHLCMQYFSYLAFRTCSQDCGIQIVFFVFFSCLPLPELHDFFSQLLAKAPQNVLFGHNSFLIPHRRQYCVVSTFRAEIWLGTCTWNLFPINNTATQSDWKLWMSSRSDVLIKQQHHLLDRS